MSKTKCLNCGKDIESFKMVLHERFCSLNVRKCSICEEPVQIDEYPEHKNQKHSEFNCERCGKTFPSTHYNSHLKTCSKKLIECQYCGLPMDQNELREHEYQCGSKTKQCEYCGMNVPIMEYELHLEYSCKIKQQFDDNNDKNTKKSNESKKTNESKKSNVSKKSNESKKSHESKKSNKSKKSNNSSNSNNNVVLEKWEKSPSEHSLIPAGAVWYP